MERLHKTLSWKLQSSMTIFGPVSAPRPVFSRVIEKYCQGRRDAKTLAIVGLR
jgi:uncharacterized protein (DUF1810 family)